MATDTTTRTDTTARTNTRASGGKFLTFFLGPEEYGLEILKVHEIISMMPITPVPRTPEYVCGVINLRGKVIPTIDLRQKFDMPTAEYTDQTCIIVVQVNGMQVGVVVDRVSEVADIADQDVDETPSFGSEVNTDYVLGIGKTDGRVRLLLDIDKVLTDGDVATLVGAAEEAI